MDIAKEQQKAIEKVGRTQPLEGLRAWLRSLRLVGLRVKLILPFMLLTVALAAVGIYVVTNLTVDSERERFDNSMIDASAVTNDGIVQFERAQLEKLRYLVFSKGMPQAVQDQDAAAIQALMEPVFASSTIDLMTALDMEGQEIITYGMEYTGGDYSKGTLHTQQRDVDFSGLALYQKVRNDTPDEIGDKFVEIVSTDRGAIIYTSAPVRIAETQEMVGVMLAGTYLDRLLYGLRESALADIVVVDPQGQVTATTLGSQQSAFIVMEESDFEELGRAASALRDIPVTKESLTQTFDFTLNQTSVSVRFSPFLIREQPVGWIGVIRDNTYIVKEAARSRNRMMFIFSSGVLLMIVVGYILARDIANPLLSLRSLTQAVANGDLKQRSAIRRTDEIGDLATSFDTMTGQLDERTEQLKLTIEQVEQRKRELEEMNNKLIATQQQLVQSEKLSSIGQLTAGIVHDVKNPFAVIMGMAEVLADDEAMDESTKHGLKVILESARKGNTIVSDLLKFARQSKPEAQYRDLRETVESSIRLTAYYTRRYNLSKDIPAEPVLTTYDAQQIEQVLINMIHNAVQAMPTGGSLRIALEPTDASARISIQDSGCGISPENIRRIFDPFFTTKPEGEGTGLGLSVSHGIIRNHNGQIDVESEIGKGTTFIITLPIRSPTSDGGETNA